MQYASWLTQAFTVFSCTVIICDMFSYIPRLTVIHYIFSCSKHQRKAASSSGSVEVFSFVGGLETAAHNSSVINTK